MTDFDKKYRLFAITDKMKTDFEFLNKIELEAKLCSSSQCVKDQPPSKPFKSTSKRTLNA